MSGAFVYSPASGTVLSGGTQTLSVTFTPTDTTDYNTATATVDLVVNKATPAVTWPVPAPITYGAALSATQLNATSTNAIGSASPNPSQINQSVTVNFTMSGSGGVPTGTVTVTASTGQMCSGTLSGGAGGCSLTFTATGSPKLTAGYSERH